MRGRCDESDRHSRDFRQSGGAAGEQTGIKAGALTTSANKKPRAISRAGLCLFVMAGLVFRSLQTRRRPTLPRVNTQYHGR